MSNMEKSAIVLEKEMTQTSYNVEDLQKNILKIEQTLHNNEAANISNQRSQILLESQQERLKEDSKKLDETVSQLHEKIRYQEKSHLDEKLDKVEKSLALMAANEEDRRKHELKDEFQKLNYTVQSFKEVMDKNENKIGEIVMKIENLKQPEIGLKSGALPYNLGKFRNSETL